MELLPSLKLILRLWNIRLYYPSWDPFLLICKSEFLLVDLMHLDAINALTEKLIFKVSARFWGPQMHLTTMRFLVNNLSLCLCTWYCLHLTHYIPSYCIIKEQVLQIHSVVESVWSTLSSMFSTFFCLKISAVVFYFPLQSWGFCGGAKSPCLVNGVNGSCLDGYKLDFPSGEGTNPWSHCLDAPEDAPKPLSSKRWNRLQMQYMYLWSCSCHENVSKGGVRKYTEVHMIYYSKDMEVEIYLQFNTLLQRIYAIKHTLFPLSGWFDD